MWASYGWREDRASKLCRKGSVSNIRYYNRILSGFPEENGSYREFLFSLPRFANNTVCA